MNKHQKDTTKKHLAKTLVVKKQPYSNYTCGKLYCIGIGGHGKFISFGRVLAANTISINKGMSISHVIFYSSFERVGTLQHT